MSSYFQKAKKRLSTGRQGSNSDVRPARSDVRLANNIQNMSKAGGGSRTQRRALSKLGFVVVGGGIYLLEYVLFIYFLLRMVEYVLINLFHITFIHCRLKLYRQLL